MGRKKKKMYFDQDVENAIIEYNGTTNTSLKNKIYEQKIHYAFDKLSENIINTFKFNYFDDVFVDVKNEVVSFLVMNMHKYDHTKGSKAFSYFSVIAKNYLILHNNSNYAKYKRTDDIKVLDDPGHIDVYTDKKVARIRDFTLELIQYLDKNIPVMFKKKKDISIAYALLNIMKNREDLENFNKKWIYILIREMTDVKTSDITKVVNVLRKQYPKLLLTFERTGIIAEPSSSFI
jgi:hypothetical protein